MDSDIGNFEKKGTRRKIVCFVCGFGHCVIFLITQIFAS